MRQLVFILLLCVAKLSGAVFHEINTTLPLCCTFSNRHHNRIVVEQGRIKKVIFPEDKVVVCMEEVSGQLFLQQKFPTPEPTVVSIVTEEGLVQDIEILFCDCPSEVVVLREPIVFETPICRETPQECLASSMGEIVDSLLKGLNPVGYISVPFRRTTLKPKFGITAMLVGRFESCADTLSVYEVSNTTLCRRRILEKEIAPLGSLWAFLEKNYLCPKEKILAIVAVQNG